MKGRSIVIGAMTRHDEVATSPVVEGEPSGAGRARRHDRRSRRCATAARSAARSPTTIRTPTIRRRCSASAPRSSPTSAHRGRRFLQGHVRDRARAGRDHHQGAVSRSAKKAAYEKFPTPASRFALVGVFVSKRGSEIRVAVTGAGAERRVPGASRSRRRSRSASPRSRSKA